ncbi:putative CPSF-domain protein [Leptomonas pyrrhocoris]|uniref:Putative CPSF-domain protein n=1 Tax=Leptomonas pyrrhocoris TaxID=157538 RepID=A0A0N0VGS7_LEPPY|nr:putative CPSF-domain protein [Leptomonas pyrrhocoris]XP_015661977.1 putative CPSF-domain protein [Leptomonas pyrrhocoris]KPA83537.1 putative CPSF-domain protein [Leptomonas pyrrhocoris]KPA83538.1 putative CPSF-domain protein [Leptomonas pyrrhocoris]|eukprot:XP_015661976.1 putative CPSF-domain protein [Leptomonas pyrrhocoris]
MYVVSTSRPSTAVFGAAVGFFCGGSTAYTVVNRGTLISLFVCRAGGLGIDHVQDIHLPCTLKYIFAVPIAEQTPPFKLSRHLLFLCTIKQEVLLVALEKATEPSREMNAFTMTTLFQGGPDDCLYQYDPGEVDLCCCSTAALDNSPSSSPTPPPFVAFALTRGGLYFFDVFAALAREGVKRKRNNHLARLFAPEVVAEVVHRGKSAVFTHCYLHATEYDVRDIAFGYHSPSPPLAASLFSPSQRVVFGGAKASSAGVPFYVLYADASGKMHVSEYELAVTAVAADSDEAGRSAAGAAARLPGQRWAPSSPTSEQDSSFYFHDRRLQRRGFLQSNVDPTALRIVGSRHGLFVAGNQLVTLIQQARPRKSVSSREIPSHRGTLDMSCATVSVDARDLVISFSDGVLVRVVVQPSELGGDEAELDFQFVPQPVPTIPTGIVALRHDLYLLYSRFDSTLTVRLGEMTCERVLENCGPVLDMTTQQSGPRCSVVACVGVQRSGGVSVLRTAVMQREQGAVPLQHSPQRILCAGGLLCVSSVVANRFFRVSTRSSTVDELPTSAFPAVVARHSLVELGQDTALDQLIMVSSRGVVWMRLLGASCEVVAQLPRGRNESDYLFANVRYGLLVLCDGKDVTVHHGQDLVFSLPSVSGVAVSALSLLSFQLLCVGDWDGNVVLYELRRPRPEVVGRLRLDSVARSIVSVAPHPASLQKGSPVHLVYIGTLDGRLLETTAVLMGSGDVRRSIFVAPHPLELQELGGHVGLLCLGNVPFVVLCKPEGVQLTGLHLMGVSAAATLDADQKCYALYSKQDGQLHIGALDSLEKTTRTFLPLGDTVTQLHDVPWWGGCAVAVRKVERDEVLFLPASLIHSPWATDLSDWRAGAVPLLENERCVFLQTMSLDGAEDTDGADKGGDREESSAPASGAKNEDDWQRVLLVGSSFTFPDEQRARSGRITWFSLRETHQRKRLHMMASKDIGGALQCCAVVPNYKGRIALGVNGCVCVYKWNAEDQTFVAEERCRLGLTVTKLIPLYHSKLATSVLVALDVRYSAFFVEVDTLQGSLKVLCRDANLRGVMDGHVGSDTDNLCLFDDNLNFTALRVTQLKPPDDAEKNASAAPQYRFEVRAQCHLGDLVTCVRPGSFAATSMLSAAEPSSLSAAAPMKLLLPGIAGPQLVFATVGGAFGVVTPLCLPTYLVLHSVEMALERVTAGFAAGLSHHTFKDVLQPGQERGVSLVASQNGGTLARDRLKRYEAINTVDGDFVENFLQLSSTEKAHVCRTASEVLAFVWTERVNDGGEFVAQPPSQEQCRFPDSASTKPLAHYPPEMLAKLNNYLQSNDLPSLPLSPTTLEQLLMNLQRVH